MKRSLSTIAACLATLRVVADRYGTKPAKERQRALKAYRRRITQFGVLDAEDEADLADLEAEEIAANLEDAADALRELIRLGEVAAPHDPKLAALVLEIRLIRLRHPNANILVYTEYTDSQRAAICTLTEIGGKLLTIGGSDSEAERTQAAERCANEDGIVLISTDSLAEGLNLHQRCFHLIHLDLPYNPNRLEQRNGRIDRYGQRNDPEIRYLFLVGTFEERLLLHLIAKYERARACLAVMPNTLGVGADPSSFREPLFAGFSEDLFSAMPRLIHSLDLAAEDTDSDAYRDLLREIDRAFRSFDHMAVRHGWLSGTESQAPPPPEVCPAIDLIAFIKSVLAPEADGYRIPPAWAQDLDGLSGFDWTTGRVRLSSNPDSDTLTHMYPGRSHPLTRRAIATVRTGRVSAARGRTLSLLMTYAVDAGAFLRTVFALQLYPDGSITQQSDFLSLASEPVPLQMLWADSFAAWAPDVVTAAAGYAAQVATRMVTAARAAYQDRLDRMGATTKAWLAKRALDLCGPPASNTSDLFDMGTSDPDWRTHTDPSQRLAAFAADPSVSMPNRREAAEILVRSANEPPSFPALTLTTLGMLMLVP